MKILNVNPYICSVSGGGTADRTFQMCRYQALEGHQVTLLTTDFGIETGVPSGLDNIQLYILPCFNKRFLIPKFNWDKLRQLVINSDVVHLMGHWTILNVLIARIAHQEGVPYVVCPAGALPIFGRSKSLKRIYNFLYGKKIIQNAALCIAITQLETEHFEEYGVSPKSVKIIPNGVDIRKIPNKSCNAREKIGLPKKPFILFLGRLNKIKGPDLLLEAYKLTKNIQHDLVFVGPDEGMLHQLKEACDTKELKDKVHFIGPLHGDEKYQTYYAADVLIVPSRQEAMSIVAIEAGITGTGVILTDQCGFDEVAAIEGGLVVAPSIAGIKSGLVKIRDQSINLELMGKKMKVFTRKNYSWSSIVQLYNKYYSLIR